MLLVHAKIAAMPTASPQRKVPECVSLPQNTSRIPNCNWRGPPKRALDGAEYG